MRISGTNRTRGSGREENERKMENESSVGNSRNRILWGRYLERSKVGQIPVSGSSELVRGLYATFSQDFLLFSKYE